MKRAAGSTRRRTLRLTARRLDYELGRLAAELRASAINSPAVTLAEAAVLAGVSYSTARRLAARGEIRPSGRRGGHAVYDVSLVMELRASLERKRAEARRDIARRRAAARRTP